MNPLMITFGIILIICSVALITIVVLQSNRGSEMTALSGRNSNASGKGQSAKRDMLMKRLTIIFGMIFVVSVMVMTLVVNKL